MTPFGMIVRDRLNGLGTNPFAMEQASPLPEKTLRNVLKGHDPRLSTVQAICDALGLELYIGPPREAVAPPSSAHEALAEERRLRELFVFIRHVDVAVAAGDGLEPGAEEELEPIAFRRDWLRARGVRPDRAVLVTARGDSMLPHIADGDHVLVDRGRTRIPLAGRSSAPRRRPPPVWVLRLDGELRIKLVEREADGVHVLSSFDAEGFPPVLVRPDPARDFAVLGHAAWWGHAQPLYRPGR